MSIAEKLTTIADNQQAVFEAGKRAGGGGDNYYDELWDGLQANGTRKNYSGAFGSVWDDTTFKPKYDIRPTSAGTIFENSNIVDLKGDLERADVVLDFSGVTHGQFAQMFQSSKVQRVGVIDTRGSAKYNIGYMFMGASELQYVEALVMTDDGTQKFTETNVFQDCKALEEIRLVGVLGCSLSFRWCPLSRASIENIVSVLSDTATGQTVTFKQSAVDAAFEAEEWTALVATKPNWEVKCV